MHILVELSRIFFSTFMLSLFMPIFLLVVFLVYLQYKRIAGMEQQLFGRIINPVLTQMAASLGLGVLGGLLASVFLLFLGLSLEQIGLYFIWPVAILLLLIHPRFLCFAYAGGIVALAVIVMRAVVNYFPALTGYGVIEALLKVHIPALLVLIALLHLMEALLIYIGGHWGSSPLYFKRPGGEVVGGFGLHRFWPLPLVALLVTVVLQTESAGVSMPEWWPVIKSVVQPGLGQTLQYMIIPVAAGLGYADLALASSPREKSRFSARNLALYSVTLLAAAVAAEFYPLFIYPAVIAAPLGHELLIRYGNRRELDGEPRFLPLSQGAQLMMVLPGSVAASAGLQGSDIILKVNGAPIQGPRELLERIEESYFMVLLEGVREEEQFSVVLKKQRAPAPEMPGAPPPGSAGPAAAYSHLHRAASLGLIMAPSPRSSVFVETRRSAPLGMLRKLLKR